VGSLIFYILVNVHLGIILTYNQLFLNFFYCQFTIYSLLEAMSKCVEGVGHVGRSHSPMALRQNIYWVKQSLGSVSHGCMKEICWQPSLQSSSVNGLGGHFSDEGVLVFCYTLVVMF
jgi:hypothetical protein